LAFANGKQVFVEAEFQEKTLFFVLLALDVGGQVAGEIAQVCIHGNFSVRMFDVHHLAVTAALDLDAVDITVGNGIDLVTRLAVGLDVEARMKMSRPQFAESGRKQHG